MGLAPYGDSKKVKGIELKDHNGLINYDFRWKLKYNKPGGDIMQHANLAAAIQETLENALISRFNKLSSPNENIVFTGGIALNSVANNKLRTHFKIKNFYLFPAQHDAGVSIGAAAAAYYHLNGKTSSYHFENDYLGYKYSRQDVLHAINKYADRLKLSKISSPELAYKLANGAIFGFFSLEKGSEFGPRALGARSILADPRSKKTWNFINRWIKFREEFRPFAPMVLREDIHKYFEADHDLPYMLEVVNVRSEFRDTLAAITHIDGTARVQTISNLNFPRMYELLKDFSKLSNFSILLNTSFNVRGQPIVEQPIQAIEMLLCTHLSGIVFDDLLVEILDDNREVTKEDIFTLSPGTKVISEKNNESYIKKMEVCNQGKSIILNEDVYKILVSLDGEKSIYNIFNNKNKLCDASLFLVLNKFRRLKYINRLN